jgi:hypothetical protein
LARRYYPTSVKPWHRLPEEDDHAHKAFEIYLAQTAPRRVDRAGKASEREALATWSKAHAWKERAAAYDLAVDLAADDSAFLGESLDAVAASHMSLLKDVRELVSGEFAKLSRLSREAGEMPGPFTLGDLGKLAGLVVQLDRLVRDQVTLPAAGEVYDFTKLSAEERSEYQRILMKITPGV